MASPRIPVNRLILLFGATALALVTSLSFVLHSSHPGPASAQGPALADVAAISAGSYHTCAVTTGGGAKCWGANGYAALGDGQVCGNICASPVDVAGLTSGVATISAGESDTCAKTTGGGLKCWGLDFYGELGNGTIFGGVLPVDVTGLTSGAALVSAGGRHTCAVTTSGGAKCWGANYSGQLGSTTTDYCGGGTPCAMTPADVVGLTSGVAAVVTSDGYFAGHSCALTTSGAVKCWGENYRGQLGDGQACGYLCSTAVSVSGLSSDVQAIDAGNEHTCALTTAGGVQCWGDNYHGQLGASCGSSCTTPVNVSGLTSGVQAIAAGGYHTCALTTTGGVKCWGKNDFGQLGNSATTDSIAPVDVAGLQSGVQAIAAGGTHTCALLTSGTVKCWGRNFEGELGDGTTTFRNTPVDVLVAPKPTPTPTPCPTDGCPTSTPTPTATPTPTPVSSAGLDFSVGTDLLSGAGEACDSSGTPTNVCNVPLGAKFNVNVYLHTLPAIGGYDAFQFYLSYAGVTATETKGAVHPNYWPDCALIGLFFMPGVEQVGCAIGIGALSSTYTGRMAAPEFTCTAAGTITLVHGNEYTSIFDNANNQFSEASDESLTINCVAPQASPGDTDGDGCSDANEQGMNQMMGGRRNFLNPWDYFNPTHDGKNRADDIYAVVSHYHKDQYLPSPPNPANTPNPLYDPGTDRTAIGPNPWNLGPPDGLVRAADILEIVKQYHHDCA